MQYVAFAVIATLVAGMAVAIQAPLSSIINQRLGQWESVFLVHLGGTVVAFVPLLFAKWGELKNWRVVPWYAYLAGALGLVVIASLNFAIPRLGSATSVSMMVAAQLALGAVLDHFGLLGLEVRPFDLPRVIGLIVLFAGVWLMVRS